MLQGLYSKRDQAPVEPQNQLKLTAVYTKFELIFGSTWSWSLLWIRAQNTLRSTFTKRILKW